MTPAKYTFNNGETVQLKTLHVTQDGQVYRKRVSKYAEWLQRMTEITGESTIPDILSLTTRGANQFTHGPLRHWELLYQDTIPFNTYTMLVQRLRKGDRFDVQYLKASTCVKLPFFDTKKGLVVGAPELARNSNIVPNLSLARLIYSTFEGIPNAKTQYRIKHLDDNYENNSIENLYLSDHKVGTRRGSKRELEVHHEDWTKYL